MGGMDEKTTFEWINGPDPDNRYLFLLVDRQYVEAWIKLVELGKPFVGGREARWHVGTCSGTAPNFHAAVCEVMVKLLPMSSAKERSERWSLHDARWFECNALGKMQLAVQSIRIKAEPLILAETQQHPSSTSHVWTAINTMNLMEADLLAGEEATHEAAKTRAEQALFDSAAYIDSRVIDTTEIDQEQLRRTADALRLLEDY